MPLVPAPKEKGDKFNAGASSILTTSASTVKASKDSIYDAAGSVNTASRQNIQTYNDMPDEPDVFVRHDQRMSYQDDNAAAMSAYVSATGKLRDFLHDDAAGLLGKSSEDAMGISAAAQEHFHEIYEETARSLGNDNQRNIFARNWQHSVEKAEDTLAEHEATQRRTFRQQNQSRLVQNAVEDVKRNPADPETLDLAKRQIIAAIRTSSPGKSVDEIKQDVHDALATFHTGIIDPLATASPEGALAYYEANQDFFPATGREDISDNLKELVTVSRADREGTEILARWETRKEALAAASRIKDEDVQEIAHARLAAHFDDQEKAEAGAEKTNRAAAWKLAEKGKLHELTDEHVDALGKQLPALKKYAKARLRDEIIETDLAVYADLSKQSAMDPAEFLDEDLSPHRAKLNEVDWQYFSQLQAAIKDEPEIGARLRHRYVLADRALQGSSWNSEKQAAFRRAIDQEIAAVELENDKDLDDAEAQKLISRLREEELSDDAAASGSSVIADAQ
jgi:hypothetical protein